MRLERVALCCGACLLFLVALLTGCGQATTPSGTTAATTGGSTATQIPGTAIRVSSPAFEAGGAIPTKYTGEGQDVSPPLTWSGLPEGTREVALICDDPDAPGPEPFVHWVVYGLPADSTGLPEGDARGALEGENSTGKTGYSGPMPPKGGGVHHYHFKVYALDTELDAAPGLTKEQLLEAVNGHVLDEGELIGTYERE